MNLGFILYQLLTLALLSDDMHIVQQTSQFVAH
jgi:hypothetical protein